MEEVLKKAIEILKNTPLCDRCLGRLFSTCGRGLSNKSRGEALKVFLTMNIKHVVNELSEDEIKDFAKNIKFKPFLETLENLGLKLLISEEPKCFLCEDKLDYIIEKYSKEILKNTVNYEFSNFLVGVHAPKHLLRREEEITRKFKIESYESIKNEIKREVGKVVKEVTDKPPEFLEPDILFEIDLVNDRLRIYPKPLFIYGKYVKAGRRISQVKWLIWKEGRYEKKYRLSIEESIKPVIHVFKGREAVLHAAGREDVDVRMLGIGRPMIIEVKEPMLRKISNERLRRIEELVNNYSRGLVKVFLKGEVRKESVREIKEESKKHFKIYRALIYSDDNLSEKEVLALEDFFKDRIVNQRTPLRVLHRRPDVLRERKVFSVKTHYICEKVFEALIKCEGGLYVKELVSGDSGRTSPSFSSVLKKNVECIELDVLYVSKK